MTYKQLIAALKERGFSFEKEKIDPKTNNDWSLHTFQLPYITGVKGEGITFFSYEGYSLTPEDAFSRDLNEYWNTPWYKRNNLQEPQFEDYLGKDYSNTDYIIFLIPDPKLSQADITYLTTNRKHNLWTDFYSTTYSGFEKYKLADMTKEQLFAQFDRQERLYKAINGLHENENMKGIIEQISTLRKEIRDKKTNIDNLNKKLADWYERIYQIEKDN